MNQASNEPAASRVRTILALGLPIIGGMVSQNVLNLVDTAMVGELGDLALAAAGIGSIVSFLAVSLVMGLSSGVQALASRRKGEGNEGVMAYPLNGALALGTAVAVPLSIVLILLAPALFGVLNDDPAVAEIGVPYLQARLAAVAAVGANFAFRGYWNGTSRPGLYMRAIMLMHVVNIALNWLLIFGHLGFPRLGVLGAGLGTAISLYFGATYYMIQAGRIARPEGFMKGLPDKRTTRNLIRVSLPSGLQTMFMAAGYTALYWIVGEVGTKQVAAANVLINLMLVAILPGMGLGLAAAALVGQALGRRDVLDARRWGWEVMRVAILVIALIALPMILIPDVVLSVFIKNPETLEIARVPLQVFGFSVLLDAAGLVLMNAIVGAGDARRAMVIVTALQWGFALPVSYLVGVELGYGLLGIWVIQGVWRAIQAGAFALVWRSDSWTRVEV